jgi:hypothetical protein
MFEKCPAPFSSTSWKFGLCCKTASVDPSREFISLSNSPLISSYVEQFNPNQPAGRIGHEVYPRDLQVRKQGLNIARILFQGVIRAGWIWRGGGAAVPTQGDEEHLIGLAEKRLLGLDLAQVGPKAV